MIKVRVPATTANLGPGFDTLGLALNLYNTFIFEEIPKGLEILGCQDEYNNEENLVYLSMKKALADMDHKISGVRITMDCNIPISGGLGSSAACIVGGVIGANELSGRPFSKDELLKIATSIEGHPDNVAPAMFGGLIVSIMEGDEVYYNSIDVAIGIKFVALIPDFNISTRDARQVLPKEISFKDGVFNVSRVALLISALSNGKFELLKHGSQDRFHQPYRSKLIPDFDEIMDICNKYKALGTFLSGAGPTIMAIIDENDKNFVHEVELELKSLNNTRKVKELSVQTSGTVLFV